MQETPDNDRNDNEPDQNKPPSKSSRKRDMTALQELGAQQVELNEQQIASMRLPEALLDAVLEAKRLNRREARADAIHRATDARHRRRADTRAAGGMAGARARAHGAVAHHRALAR